MTATPRSVTIELKGSVGTWGTNPNRYRGVRAKIRSFRAASEKAIVAIIKSDWDGNALGSVYFDIIEFYCGKSTDPDNLIAGMKPVIDAFTHKGVILDDKAKYVKGYGTTYVQVPHRNQRKVVIQCQEVIS